MTGTELRLKTNRVLAEKAATHTAMIDGQIKEILFLCDAEAEAGKSYLNTKKSYHSDAIDKLAQDKSLNVKRPGETRHGELIISW